MGLIFVPPVGSLGKFCPGKMKIGQRYSNENTPDASPCNVGEFLIIDWNDGGKRNACLIHQLFINQFHSHKIRTNDEIWQAINHNPRHFFTLSILIDKFASAIIFLSFLRGNLYFFRALKCNIFSRKNIP